MSNKSYRFLTLSATQCSASQLKLYNFCMETDSYFTYSMPAQLWCRGRIALAQNNQAKFCVFRCNQEDSSRSKAASKITIRRVKKIWVTREKSSLFPYKKTAFLSGTPNVFGSSYFEAALVISKFFHNI